MNACGATHNDHACTLPEGHEGWHNDIDPRTLRNLHAWPQWYDDDDEVRS